MLCRIFAFIILAIFCLSAHAEQCPQQSQLAPKTNSFMDDWWGLKCDPLDSADLKDKGFKTPCDCLAKGERFSRIKSMLYGKSRKSTFNKIEEKAEEKIADVIRNQIDSGFDQSLRLDTLLKQGVIDLDNEKIKYSFPASCRASGIDDVINNALEESKLYGGKSQTCAPKTLKKRLKLLLNGKDNFAEYIKDKKTTYSQVALNKLTDDAKSKGMCIPYKTYQSLNNKNPLRPTYLKIAKGLMATNGKSSYENFQKWASNMNDPLNREFVILKDLGDGRARADSLFKNETISHLLKTDPIFERMIKDPDFFHEMASGKFEKHGSVSENDPALIGAMMRSQEAQCKKLYGAVEDKANIDERENEDTGEKAEGRKRKQSKKVQPKKNLLTRFLCEEDFPKKFVDKNAIRSVFAPELKEELNIKSLSYTEATIAKWAFCKSDNAKESEDGGFSIEFNNDANGNEPDPSLAQIMNITLNPKSEIFPSTKKKDSGVNDYERFNKIICEHVKPVCKNLEVREKGLECSTTNVAKGAVFSMMSILGEKNAAEFIKKNFDNFAIADIELREKLLETGKFSNEEADTLIILRNQSMKAKSLKSEAGLKYMLNLPQETNLKKYFEENGGRSKVLASKLSEKEQAMIAKDVVVVLVGDNIYEEKITDGTASFFTNYYTLAKDTDEKEVKNNISNQGNSPGPAGKIGDTSNPVPNGNRVGGLAITGTGGGSSGAPIVTPIYQRKSFYPTEPEPTLPSKPLAPQKPVTDIPVKTEPAPKEVKAEEPKATKAKTPLASETLVQKPVLNNNLAGASFSLTSSGTNSSSGGKMRKDESEGDSKELRDLERQAKELEEKIKKTQNEIDKMSDSSGSGDGDSAFEREKKSLEDQINKLKNAPKRRIENNDNTGYQQAGVGNNFRNDEGNASWSSNNNSSMANNFNNGYRRGEEFDKEKATNKLDDGSQEFDPENSDGEKSQAASVGRGSGGGKKGKGGSGGPVGLSASGDGDDSDFNGVGGGRGKRGGRRGTGEDSDVVLKCGTGSVMRCIFPNSYFIDTKKKNRLYVTINNLKLEGRQFQGLEKVRKSKKDMRMGESNKAKYFLYTYDLVVNENGKYRQVSDSEREAIYNEIKKNRSDPTFKKKLLKYQFMTRVVPPKIILNDNEAQDAIKRSITKDEYEELQN